jgi:peptide/nickel transport system substrate-binding protein
MYVPIGQMQFPAAYRKSLTGVLDGPVPVFWNVEKK